MLRLKHFLIGRRFVIRTDHEPLHHLFGSNTSIPSGPSTRICRWALALMPSDFEIKCIKGNDISHVDALPCMSFSTEVDGIDLAEMNDTINCVMFKSALLDSNQARLELSLDPFTQRIMHHIHSGDWMFASGGTFSQSPGPTEY